MITNDVSMLRVFLMFLLLGLVACGGKEPQTPSNVSVVQLRELSEIATVEYVISKIVKAQDNPAWFKYGDRKILMSCQATIKAGIDMDLITQNNIHINASSIVLELPPARVLSLNIHPESIQEEYVKTDFFRSRFTNEERYAFLQQAEEEIRASIPGMGILQAAEANSALFFESWLRLMGFENVQIVFKSTSADSQI